MTICPLHVQDALLLIDVQNDFLPGGNLAVAQGDKVLAPLNTCLEQFSRHGLPIFATCDWHPVNHCSFLAQGGPWPPHCIAGSIGAQFSGALNLPEHVIRIEKSNEAGRETYSGFTDTRLDALLRQAGVRRLFVGGLATDYCVLNTVCDALQRGYEVQLLTDAIAAVDVTPGDGERAIAEMQRQGARCISVAQIGA